MVIVALERCIHQAANAKDNLIVVNRGVKSWLREKQRCLTHNTPALCVPLFCIQFCLLLYCFLLLLFYSLFFFLLTFL